MSEPGQTQGVSFRIKVQVRGESWNVIAFVFRLSIVSKDSLRKCLVSACSVLIVGSPERTDVCHQSGYSCGKKINKTERLSHGEQGQWRRVGNQKRGGPGAEEQGRGGPGAEEVGAGGLFHEGLLGQVSDVCPETERWASLE